MAFVYTLQFSALAASDIVRADREYVVPVDLGFDDETGARFTLVVIMTPMIGYDAGAYELIFNIVKSASDEDSETIYWDGLATRHVIRDPVRRAEILQALAAAVAVLIDVVSPQVVCFVTYAPHLPERALAKYAALVSLLEARSYRLDRHDIYLGQQMWTLVHKAADKRTGDYDDAG